MLFQKIYASLFFIAVISVVCFSCSYKQQQALFENKKTPDSPTNRFNPVTNYTIKPQDILQIRNLQSRKYIVDEPTTSVASVPVTGNRNESGQTYTVEEDGTVRLPIIGSVKVVGLSRAEAANQIESLYRRELKDPIIELKIVNLKVTMLGEIKAQGIYNLIRDRTSLIEVIGEAGGLTEKANPKTIKIIRGNMRAPQVIEVDLSDINTLADSRIMLENNDIIYIAQNKRAIRAEKLQNMSSILQPVIALLNTALIIYTLTR